MRRIAVLGCSWTQGHRAPYSNSWSRILASRYPDTQFLDLSKGGSSIQFAQFALTHLPRDCDLVIAQYTSPYRLTVWPQNFNLSNYLKQQGNYVCFDNDLLEKDCAFTSTGWLGEPRYGFPGIGKQIHKNVRNYYTLLPDEFHEINHSAGVEWLHNRVDFGFSWQTPSITGEATIQSWDQFEELCIDDYGHFGIRGSELVADWIEQEVSLDTNTV